MRVWLTMGWAVAVSLGCAGLGEQPLLGLGAVADPDAPTPAVPASAPADDSVPAAEPEPALDGADISLKALALADELVEAEQAPPPFSDEEPEPLAPEVRAERVDALAAWAVDHPEALTHGRLLVDRLHAHADERAEEALAGLLADLQPKDPLQVEVATAPWRLVVAYANAYDTSEDWAFFVHDVFEAGKEHAVGQGHLKLGHDRLQVTRRGIVVHEVELPPEVTEPFASGYLAVMEGKAPVVVGHAPPDEVLEELSDYFGIRLAR